MAPQPKAAPSAPSVDKASMAAPAGEVVAQAGKPQAAEILGPEVLPAREGLPEMAAQAALAVLQAMAARQALGALQDRAA